MKQFIVAIIVDDIDLGDGVCAHLLVASDGDAWMVHRQRDVLFPSPWDAGEIVAVPLKLQEDVASGDRWFEPDWMTVHAEDATHTPVIDEYHHVIEALWRADTDER